MGGRSASAGGGVSGLGGGAAWRRVVCGGLVAGGGAAGGGAAAGGAVESESGSRGCGRGNCTCVWGMESGWGGGAGAAGTDGLARAAQPARPTSRAAARIASTGFIRNRSVTPQAADGLQRRSEEGRVGEE